MPMRFSFFRGTMKRFRQALLIVPWLFAGVPTSLHGEGRTLKIEINADQQAVKNNRDFEIDTKIRNIAKETQVLRIWSCSYSGHWKVRPSWNPPRCAKF